MQWPPIFNQPRNVPIALDNPNHGPFNEHRPLNVPWRAALTSKNRKPYDDGRDYVDLVHQTNLFTVQASKAVIVDRARKFYVYIDLHESAEQCDLFLKAINYHPLFVVKPFGFSARQIFVMNRGMLVRGIDAASTITRNMHAFEVEFVGDRRIAAFLLHPFREKDGDQAIVRRVFSFVRTTYSSGVDGPVIHW